MARQNLTEAGAHTEILEARDDGSFLIQVITPGWGSSGYYSPEVLEAAGKAKVWPAGTHMYFDHPSVSESEDRPERSVKDLAATLTEDARWDGKRLVARAEPVGLGKTVLADEAFRKAVACSVRASAEMNIGEAEGRKGWIVEKIHPDTFNSVDFVTHAGRGGMILEAARRAQEADEHVTEASDKAWSGFSQADYDDAQWKRACLIDKGDGEGKQRYSLPVKEPDGTLNRNAVHAAAGRLNQVDVDAGKKKAAAKKLVSLYRNQLDEDPPESLLKAAGMAVSEALSSDVERAIRDAVSAAYSSHEKDTYTYAWLRDYDPDKGLAYFEIDTDGKCSTYSQAYTVGDSGEVALTGDRTEVNQRTEYVPAATTEAAAPPNVPVHPAGQSTTTKEHTMPEIEEGATVSVQENRLRQLETDAGRVPLLESERDTARTALAEARQELAVEKAKTYAREFGTDRVREANSELDPAAVDRIVAEAMRTIPLTEGDDQRLDTEVFGKQVDTARTAEETYLATVIKNRGGSVRGLGQTDQQPQVTEADVNNIVAGAFGRTVKGA